MLLSIKDIVKMTNNVNGWENILDVVRADVSVMKITDGIKGNVVNTLEKDRNVVQE